MALDHHDMSYDLDYVLRIGNWVSIKIHCECQSAKRYGETERNEKENSSFHLIQLAIIAHSKSSHHYY